MGQVQEMLERYKQIRARLRNPPNAVPDAGINLRPSRQQLTEEPPPQPLIQEPSKKSAPKVKENRTYKCLLNGLTLSSTLQITAEEFGVTIQEIRSNSRVSSIAWPRQVAMYIATERQGRGLSWVARQMGRDHTTVLYARDKIKDLVSSDPNWKNVIDTIENKIAIHATASISANSKPHLATQQNWDVPLQKLSTVD